ncbi:hypothetical protein [Streptomyces pacificus]|uniref:HK97 gp10 family phage protein n=1 Tax=Streptomyces pacificus TaxID=2705029 RepID=A0A6A0AN75_9ACTN|nr:hypothetical protein [Streptomyces pacificus]GFH34292.1 hypothetical protein SCWH03_05060 [Streptomyces pacificus]
MSINANTRQLDALASVFRVNGVRAQIQVRAVVARGALNVKNGWRANAAATAGRHARLYPSSVSYDMKPHPTGAAAEIGPDKSRPQGALGNLLEFGSVKNPPHMDGARALAAEAAEFTAHVAAIGAQMGRG